MTERLTNPSPAAAAEAAVGPVPCGAAAEAPLTQRVADAIRDLIVQDQLGAGARIRERDLAARLNVSRTPLREAIKILAAEGLVELSPNRGARVADPTPRDVRDMLRVLGSLEALAGELACEAASDDEVSEISALHYEMLAAYARKARLDYFKLNQRIHLALVAGSHNRPLIEIHRQLNARLYRVRYLSNLRNRTWPAAIEQHEQILDALTRRDGPRLATILRIHLGNTWIKASEVLTPAADWRGDTD